jgi:hypothetical protein
MTVTVNFTSDAPVDAAKFLVAVQASNKGALMTARIGIPAPNATGKETNTAAFNTGSLDDFEDFVKELAGRSPGHIAIL